MAHFITRRKVMSKVRSYKRIKWTISASYPLVHHAVAMINANSLRISCQLDPYIAALAVPDTFFESVRKRMLAFYYRAPDGKRLNRQYK